MSDTKSIAKKYQAETELLEGMDLSIAKKYQKLSPREHILKRPEMYIGKKDPVHENMMILQDDKIIDSEISYSLGLFKLFDEILMNAYDETTRDETLTEIKVDIDIEKNQISVYNNGKGIDVVMHPEHKVYVPELIFGQLMTSTSFEEDQRRLSAGLHGLGAKLTNVLSKYFKVEVGDPKSGKSFEQVYKNNLSEKSKPIIKPYKKDTGYVKITFQPDLEYFGLTKFDDDFVSLISRRAYDIAALTGPNVQLFLNGTQIPVKTFPDYVQMYIGDRPRVEEFCEKTENFKDGRWQIVISSSPDEKFRQISFVNGVHTSYGGKHVDYIVNQIVKQIQKAVKKRFKGDIRDSFIKDRFWIFLAAQIENPSFSSQTKEELTTSSRDFGSVCILSKNFIKKMISKLNISNEIISFMKAKQLRKLEKTDVAKRSTIKGIPKLYDANFAGTKKSRECTLILTEGDSAKAMAISGLSAIPKGNDTFGVFPLKGKLLNVREATGKQILNNEEFKNLKKIIGLKMGTTYNQEKVGELRYGSILLMMDADVDGSHIKGLFINMLEYYWPSLLKLDGFIKILITPIVKVKKGQEMKSFYSQDEYEQWKKTVNIDKWDIKYYKGLGTNTALEAREYFRELQKNTVIFDRKDERCNQSIILAFSKKQADNRKRWLAGYDKTQVIDQKQDTLSCYDFIHKELIHFSNYDNIRSIPNVMDGFKPSQRKVLFACFKRNLTKDIKVAQLVGYISEQSAYHHGEMSLTNTVIGLCQNFVGSNNINLLEPKGQFGTRLLGGKDHSSARYIFTHLATITRLIFRQEDDALLNYLDDDGFQIEPEYYLPIIPMILVNGAEGIGTGYSTSVPKYNPVDLIKALKSRLNGGNFTQLKPWYRGFTGRIIKTETGFMTVGTIKQEKKFLQVTELPVGIWTENYKIFLENMVQNKKLIRTVKNNSNESDVEFSLRFRDDGMVQKVLNQPNLANKILRLTSKFSTGNMHLFNSESKMTRYTVNKIMEEFYQVRLEYYQKRKDHLLKLLDEEIKILDAKARFIEGVISRKIKLYQKSKKEIHEILQKEKFPIIEGEPPFDYLIRMSFYAFTREKVEELKKKLGKKKKERSDLKKKEKEQLWIDDLEELERALP